ncbi:MAG: TIGR01777 family protein [Opitutae bacterium]|nr:TIGR01777 family protein [Opitutae bacterium]
MTILSRSGKSRIWGVPAEQWDPRAKAADWKKLEGIDGWIHLAGENLASGRWTSKKMKSLRSSRVEGTRFLAEGFKQMSNPPKVFIGASGIGYYGDGADAELTETRSKGSGFLADLCEDWEGASTEMEAMGMRRVILRIGMVLTPKGGALAKLLPVYKAGLGGRQGGGTQYWSWIAMDDLLRVFHIALLNPHFRGVYNAVSPTPLQNREFSSALARKVSRPGVCSAPRGVLTLLLGRMAKETLLASQRVIPQRLTESGFRFDFPTLDLTLSHLLGRH